MAGFVKLDSKILSSTLWFDRDSRDVFITALLMAMPHEIKVPMEQMEVDSFAPTGFVVQPGWYGFIESSGRGIVNRAVMDSDAGISALRRLGSPEEDSKGSDHEGRRLVRVDGGYVVLNFMKYREKDHGNADRCKRWRERTVTTRMSSVATPHVDMQAEDRRQKTEETENKKAIAPYPVAFEDFWKASWKHGSKGDAFKAWKQNGSPSAEESAPAIAAYLAAKKSSRQALANVGVWLRAGGAKQTEWHLAPIGTSNFKPALPQAAPAPYHAPAKPAAADWSKLAPWPKEKP